MNVVIPDQLHKRVRAHARKRGISEDAYIHGVITHALAADNELDEDMRLWEQASLYDFNASVKKHKL